jgi:acylphosphatase
VKRLSIVVHGRVQGVGFRYFTQEIADLLKISGWTRNTSEGDVEIEAQGEETQLNLFVDRIKEGPANANANVKECRISEITIIKNEREFKIRH